MGLIVFAVLLVGSAVWAWPERHRWQPPAGAQTAAPPVQRKRGWSRPRRRDRAAADEHLLRLAEALVAVLDVGLPPAHALELALQTIPDEDTLPAGLRRELAELASIAQRGEPLGPQWLRLGREHRSALAAALGRAWQVSDEVGAPLAVVVRSVCAGAVADRRHQRSVAAVSAGPRATMQVLTLLPVLGVAAMPLVGFAPTQVYTAPVLMLAVLPGVLLVWCGRGLVRRMLRTALAPAPVS